MITRKKNIFVRMRESAKAQKALEIKIGRAHV